MSAQGGSGRPAVLAAAAAAPEEVIAAGEPAGVDIDAAAAAQDAADRSSRRKKGSPQFSLGHGGAARRRARASGLPPLSETLALPPTPTAKAGIPPAPAGGAAAPRPARPRLERAAPTSRRRGGRSG